MWDSWTHHQLDMIFHTNPSFVLITAFLKIWFRLVFNALLIFSFLTDWTVHNKWGTVDTQYMLSNVELIVGFSLLRPFLFMPQMQIDSTSSYHRGICVTHSVLRRLLACSGQLVIFTRWKPFIKFYLLHSTSAFNHGCYKIQKKKLNPSVIEND